MSQKTILVVEDDDNILELITFHLKHHGFAVDQTFTGEEALERAFVNRPDLILLDLMLPAMNGLEVCATLKNDVATRGIPVVIVSARGADTDVVAGLEAGADDYVVKPFSPATLMDRVHAVLVKQPDALPEFDQDLELAGLTIRPKAQEVCVGDRPVSMRGPALQVLHDLARHAGTLRTRGQIKAALGLTGEDAEAFSVDEVIASLCRLLEDKCPCIEAVRRIGFRFKDPSS